MTATGGDVANVGSNTFSYGVDGTDDPGDNEMDPGEALTFSDLDAVVTFGGGATGSATIDSANFEFFQARFPGGGDIVELTGADGSTLAPVNVPNGGGNDPFLFDGSPLLVDDGQGNLIPDPNGGVSSNPQTSFSVTAGSPPDLEDPVPNGFGVDTIRARFMLTISGDGVLKGDVDRNGVVDFFDIQPFIDVLSSGESQPEADVHCNGVVDFFDTQPFIDVLAS